MTAICEKCEPKLSDDEIKDAYKIDEKYPSDYCAGCLIVIMRLREEVKQ